MTLNTGKGTTQVRMDSARRTKQAHQEAVRVTFQDLVAYLRDVLGTRLVAHIAGVSTRQVTRWLEDGTTRPRDDAERRLRAAYEVFVYLTRSEEPIVVRSWFIGTNPQLDDVSPTEALAEDRFREVRSAAEAFTLGG